MVFSSIHWESRSGRFVLISAGYVLGFLTSLSTLGCELARPERPASADQPRGPTTLLTVVDGEDYYLPGWVGFEPYAGYVDHPQIRDGRGGDLSIGCGGGQIKRRFLWRELEPVKGEYDFSSVAASINQAVSGNYKIQLQVWGTTQGSSTIPNYPLCVPDWVMDAYDLHDDLVNLGGRNNLWVIPGWRDGIRHAFDDMIRALGAWLYDAHYPDRANAIGSAYVHGISPSQGEEFWLDHWDGTMSALEAVGMTANALFVWFSERIDTYADVFGDDIYKVAWVGTTWKWHDASYEQMSIDLWNHAFDRGLGIRKGNIERYFHAVNEPALGQHVDADGYLTVDESHPAIASVRYFGDENEEYSAAFVDLFGDPAMNPHRYRFALLVALQRRYRWLWTHYAPEEINPPLSAYWRTCAGKTVENSPDAWAYLSQTPALSHQSPVGWVKNIERWLLQRDVPGGMTVPVDRVDRPFHVGVDGSNPKNWYDFTARRTDVDEGNPYIYFDLDDRFLVVGRALIKVEFRDVGDAAWGIEYMGHDGELKATPRVQNVDDGEVKTATFALDDARFENGLPHGMDLRIVSDGPEDVTVRWVRVIREDGV